MIIVELSALILDLVIVIMLLGIVWRGLIFWRTFSQTSTYSRWKKARYQRKNAERVVRINRGVRRGIQRTLARVSTSVPFGHSHAEAASERNGATESMLACVRAMGLTPYVISPSPREDGLDGVRYYYSLADLNQEIRDNPIGPNHCLVMTDVDYYVDMAELLSYGRPILAYTFHPERVSGSIANGFFTIENDIVKYRVSGGKTVSHGIWDYNQDVIYTQASDLSIWEAIVLSLCRALGFRRSPRGVASHVDQFRLSDHRRIVAITPFAKIHQRVRETLYGTELKRCQYTHRAGDDEFNILTTLTDDTPVVSLSLNGQLAQATIPLSDYESIIIAHQEATAKHLSDTVRRSKLAPNEAAVLHRFLNTGIKPTVEVHQPGKLARHFVCSSSDSKTVFDQPKRYAREFANSPLDISAVFPAECEDNDSASIEGRVTRPQLESSKGQKILPRFYKYAADFVAHVVTTKHKGRPWSVSQVDEKQSKPTQRARSRQRSMDYTENFLVKAFQKREAYNGPNEPRNISTCPTTHTLRLSSFTYAFKTECLADKDWYVPGRIPRRIAEDVHDLALRNSELVETDFSRFDGYINRWLRTQVEFPCYLSWVHADERDELHTLLYSELEPKSRTRTKTYNAGCSRLSGSPLTTDGNTIINAFTAYAAAREEGLSDAEALGAIGLAYGDDGLRSGLVSNHRMETTAKLLGLKLKIENRASKGQHIAFLSRVYPDAWSSTASIQAPKRALMKLHTTTNKTDDINEMGLAKVTGYLITDPLTPFISDWCKTYLRCSARNALDDVTSYDDTPFWARDTACREGPWPQTEGTGLDIIASELGVSTSTLLDHVAELQAYDGDVMSIPQLQTGLTPPARTDHVLDGEIHHVGSTTGKPVHEQAKPTKICKDEQPKERISQNTAKGTRMPFKPSKQSTRPANSDPLCGTHDVGPRTRRLARKTNPRANGTNSQSSPKLDGKASRPDVHNNPTQAKEYKQERLRRKPRKTRVKSSSYDPTQETVPMTTRCSIAKP
jgi:hypothetical protein